MKKMASMLLAGLFLSACGSAPPQISGNNRVSIGVSAGDANSTMTVTRNYTPAEVDENGKVTPEKIDWSTTAPNPVPFVFMARPGSDAAYITGYRILRYDYNGKVSTNTGTSEKINIYVPSGYDCPERDALTSCNLFNEDGSPRTDVVQANGLPTAELNLNFVGALVPEVKRTLADAYSVVDLEFFGHSANGQPVSVIVRGVTSHAYKGGN